MKFINVWMIAPLIFGLTLTSCNKDKSEKPDSATAVARFLWSEKLTPTTEAQIKVINQYGEAVKGAQILIGDAQGSPFKNNYITTDNMGLAAIPNEWQTPASVTVDAKAYIRQTLLNVNPGNLTFKMSSAYLAQRAEVRGQITQLPIVNGDKLIDFALVMPVLSKSDFLNFDISQVVSPYTDTMSAGGQDSSVSSNISLPKQKENYIISITLNKPIYRFKVPTLGPKKIVAARGRFVFKTVAAELRNGKPFHDLINHFSILGGSIRDVTLTGPITQLDIPGNELQFNNTLSVNSTAIQSDELLLLLATNEIDGSMIPTDFKRAVSGKVTHLQSMSGKPSYIVSVVKKQGEFMSSAPGSDRMSASLLPHSTATAQKLLPLIANPSILKSNNYVIQLPALPATAGVNALATSASISDLIEVQDNNKKILVPIRKWEIVGIGWIPRLNLPKWPLDNSNTRKRVEVNYLGTTSNTNIKLNNSLFENVTHLTHASADF